MIDEWANILICDEAFPIIAILWWLREEVERTATHSTPR